MCGIWTYAGANQGALRPLQGINARDMSLTPAKLTIGSVYEDEAPYLHCDEQTLEEYCLDILDERRTSAVEEHMLVCEECRAALAAQTEFIQCLKAALRAQRIPQKFNYLQKSA